MRRSAMPAPHSLIRVEPGGPVLVVHDRDRHRETSGWGFIAYEFRDIARPRPWFGVVAPPRWYPANANGVATEYELLGRAP